MNNRDFTLLTVKCQCWDESHDQPVSRCCQMMQRMLNTQDCSPSTLGEGRCSVLSLSPAMSLTSSSRGMWSQMCGKPFHLEDEEKSTGLVLIVCYQSLSLFFWLHLPIIWFSTTTLSLRVFLYESCSLYHFHSPAPFYSFLFWHCWVVVTCVLPFLSWNIVLFVIREVLLFILVTLFDYYLSRTKMMSGHVCEVIIRLLPPLKYCFWLLTIV